MLPPFLGPLLYRAHQWVRSTATILRPRSTSDRVILGTSDLGTTAPLSVDGGSNAVEGIIVNGRSTFYGDRVELSCTNDTTIPVHLRIQESGAGHLTCVGVTSGTAGVVAMYMKNNHLVFAYTCGANGTNRYLSISLDGQTCTWGVTTTGPL